MLMRCYIIELDWDAFSAMKRRDVVSWSKMISGFIHCGMPDEAIAVFQEMNQTREAKCSHHYKSGEACSVYS